MAPLVQTITVRTADEAALRDLITTWHADRHGTAPLPGAPASWAISADPGSRC